MSRFSKFARGSISIFLVIILLPTFTISGLIVDFARLNIAKSMTSSAGDLALNTALTNYDTVLKDVYGIFSLSQNCDNPQQEMQQNIYDYFERTIIGTTDMNEAEAKDYVSYLLGDVGISPDNVNKANFMDMTIDDFSVNYVEGTSLANPQILKKDILEYMKYRGPIEFASTFLESLMSFSKVNKQTEVTKQKVVVDEAAADLQQANKKLYDSLNSYSELYGKFDGDTIKTQIDSINKDYYNAAQIAIKFQTASESKLITGSSSGGDVHKLYENLAPKLNSLAVNSNGTAILKPDVSTSINNFNNLNNSINSEISSISGSAWLPGEDVYDFYFRHLDSYYKQFSLEISFIKQYNEAGWTQNYLDAKEIYAKYKVAYDNDVKSDEATLEWNNNLPNLNAQRHLEGLPPLPEKPYILSKEDKDNYSNASNLYGVLTSCEDSYLLANQVVKKKYDNHSIAFGAQLHFNDNANKTLNEKITQLNELRVAAADVKAKCAAVKTQIANVKAKNDELGTKVTEYNSECGATEGNADNFSETMSTEQKKNADAYDETKVAEIETRITNNSTYFDAVYSKLKEGKLFDNELVYEEGKVIKATYGPEEKNVFSAMYYNFLTESERTKLGSPNFKLSDDRINELIPKAFFGCGDISLITSKAYDVKSGDANEKILSYYYYLNSMFRKTDSISNQIVISKPAEGDPEYTSDNATAAVDNANTFVSDEKGETENEAEVQPEDKDGETENIFVNLPSKGAAILVEEDKSEISDNQYGSDFNYTEDHTPDNPKGSETLGKQTSVMSIVLGGIGEALEKGRDDLFVMQYIDGMFTCNTTGKIYKVETDRSITRSTETKYTLSGIPMNAGNNVMFGSEMEYIIFGNESLTKNVKTAKTSIFAIRMGMNTVFAFTNPSIRNETRTFAMSISAATCGLAPVPLVQAILQLAYSAAESALDLSILSDGGKVPIYKTTDTWVMSARGAVNYAKDKATGIANQAITTATDKAVSAIENVVDDAGADLDKAARNLTTAATTAIKGKSEELIMSLFQQMTDQIESALDKINYDQNIEDIKTQLKETIENAGDSIDERIEALKSEDSDEGSSGITYKVLSWARDNYITPVQKKFIEEIDTWTADDSKEYIFDKVAIFRNNIVTSVVSQLEKIELAIESKISGLVGDLTTELNDIVKDQGDKAAEMLKEKTTGYINDAFDKVEKKIDLDKISTQSTGGSGKKSGVSSALASVLSFGYEDYLKLFLFINLTVNEDNMLKRTADVIQINMVNGAMGDNYENKGEFLMANAYTYVQIDADMRLEPLFLNLPVITTQVDEINADIDESPFDTSHGRYRRKIDFSTISDFHYSGVAGY